VPLEELAVPFARHLCEHLRVSDKQGTSAQSRFLEACRARNRGELTPEQLIEQTARLGFNNVIDAFHVVNQGEVRVRFVVDERRQKPRGIRLTDELCQIREDFQYRNLPAEVEARWRLVETAWDLDLPRHVLAVTYEPEAEVLVVQGGKVRRRVIMGSRDALNGYQKGRCFYCQRDIDAGRADVDHFFPHTLLPQDVVPNIDGIWNLVLACASNPLVDALTFAVSTSRFWAKRFSGVAEVAAALGLAGARNCIARGSPVSGYSSSLSMSTACSEGRHDVVGSGALNTASRSMAIR
jgi:hypothetical protein